MYHQGLQIFLPSETPVKRNRQASIVGIFFFLATQQFKPSQMPAFPVAFR